MEFTKRLGIKIKELRKERGLKQFELAEGICSQAQISKIEKGQVEPLSSTLYLIANRLNVQVSHFFNHIPDTRDYLAQMIVNLKAARKNSDFQLIKHIIEEHENKRINDNNETLAVLTWYKGLYNYYLNKDLIASTDLLKKAITLADNNTVTKNEILNDIGVLLIDAGEFSLSINYLQDSLRNLEITESKNPELQVRIIYNLICCLFELKKYKDAIYYCHLAINICIEAEKMDYFRELHYWLGELYEQIREYDRALFYYEHTINLYEGKKELQLITYLQDRSKQLKEIINTEKSLQKSKKSHGINKELQRNLA